MRRIPAARADCDAGDVVIGFVGSFSSFHGIEVLKQVVAGLCPARAACPVSVRRRRHALGDLREFCRRSGHESRVRFTGHVAREHVPALMAATDILVAPYSREAFFYFSPIKLFEYMSCGKAVVATRIGQIADVVDDGRTGLLYDPDDTDGLIDRLAALIRDPELRTALGRRARAAIESDYSWTANATKVAGCSKARWRGARS
jgi:glycosyltransferase involved in cell wall biosynthesis